MPRLFRKIHRPEDGKRGSIEHGAGRGECDLHATRVLQIC
jgi:hypothetical protein